MSRLLSRSAGAAVLGGGSLVILLWLAIFVVSLSLTIHGLYLAFSASIVLGICALILEPSPLIISLIYLAFHYNIPQKIVEAIG
jgi:hypothetical protein